MFIPLNFVGNPDPAAWYTISETITNIPNKITLIQNWDHTRIVSPNFSTAPVPKQLSKHLLFVLRKEIMYAIPTTIDAKTY